MSLMCFFLHVPRPGVFLYCSEITRLLLLADQEYRPLEKSIVSQTLHILSFFPNCCAMMSHYLFSHPYELLNLTNKTIEAVFLGGQSTE